MEHYQEGQEIALRAIKQQLSSSRESVVRRPARIVHVTLPIEPDIPIPVSGAGTYRAKRCYIRTIERMEIGDSVLIPEAQYVVMGMLSHWRKLLNLTFVTRTTTTGVRVWRVK